MSNNNDKTKVHEYVSAIFSAPFIALYILLRLTIDKTIDDLVTFTILSIGLVIIPLVFPLFIAFRQGYEWDYPIRSTRIVPFSIVTIFYFITLGLTIYFRCSNEIIFLALSYSMNGLVSLLISLKYKVSIHLVGIAGPMTYFYLLGYWIDAFILCLIAFITAYSRFYLRRHTMPQLVMGVIIGIIFTYISYLIVYYYNSV
ncbi:hypothetical protein [Staphylothermus hellenicus]|uniref:hypothetical protein n=1 Tax=Staphylothermus hellenicus TaxID=84599 RepID=UPI0011E55D4B|nr:hypothetical protein [Staphylothermus hellenicus]